MCRAVSSVPSMGQALKCCLWGLGTQQSSAEWISNPVPVLQKTTKAQAREMMSSHQWLVSGAKALLNPSQSLFLLRRPLDLGGNFGVCADLANPRVCGSTHTAASEQAWGREKEPGILVSLQSVPKSGHSGSHTLSPGPSGNLGSLICKVEAERTDLKSARDVRERRRAGQRGMENTLCDPNRSSQALAVLLDCGQPARTDL